MVASWAAGGSVGPGRSCRTDTAWAGADSPTKELTCLVYLAIVQTHLVDLLPLSAGGCWRLLGLRAGSPGWARGWLRAAQSLGSRALGLGRLQWRFRRGSCG